MITMLPVVSHNLHSIGYDEAGHVLHVRFAKWDNKTDPGNPKLIPAKLYTYDDVPPQKFADLLNVNAKVLEAQVEGSKPDVSVGAHFNAEIKNGGYKFRPVDENVPA